MSVPFPHQPLRFNLLQYEMQSGADAAEITRCLMTVGETLTRSAGGGDNEKFWEQTKFRVFFAAIVVLMIARQDITTHNIHRFINTAATDPKMLTDPAWEKRYHYRTLKAAEEAEATPIQASDLQMAKDMWIDEYPFMDAKLRGSILADLQATLAAMNSGVTRSLLSSTTNISPRDIDNGALWLVDMPVPQYGASGLVVNAAVKYAVQRHILRRKGEGRLAVIWADECQNHINSYDATFLAEARSHRGSMVYLTQSLPSFYTAMKGKSAHDEAEALLANFNIKVFHALADAKTAEWAASLVGKQLQTYTGGALKPTEGVYDELFGGGSYSGNFSSHMENALQARDFMTGLRCGGEETGYMVDGIAIRAGEPWANGTNWLRVSFSQK